jgi:hypothetical protein
MVAFGSFLAIVALASYSVSRIMSDHEDTAIAQTGPSQEERDNRWEEREKQLQQDNAKPDFTGRLGEFIVVSTVEEAKAMREFCPAGTKPAGIRGNFRSSELNVPNLWSQTVCEDGTVARTYSGTGRLMYFRGSPIVTVAGAPLERLKRTVIDGKPALLVEPPVKPGPSVIHVIERMPVGNKPGILLSVMGHESVEASLPVVREVLAR